MSTLTTSENLATVLKDLERKVEQLPIGAWGSQDADLLHGVYEAQLSMGTFAHPSSEFEGITLNEWQFEQARQAVLVVLKYLSALGHFIGDSSLEGS